MKNFALIETSEFVIQNVPLKTQFFLLYKNFSQNEAMKPMTVEFLQPCSVATADELLEIVTAVISAILSVDKHFLQIFSVSHRYMTINFLIKGEALDKWHYNKKRNLN
jgi:hypothetical protein